MKTKIKYLSEAVLVILMISLLTSCAFNQQLPSNWTLPALASIGNCPDISGKYIGLGETIKNKTTVPLIYELFVTAKDRKQYPLVRWQEVSHISIQQGQNLLNVVAWKDSEVLYSTGLSKDTDDFVCEDGWLTVKTSHFRGVGLNAVEFGSISRSFAKADGYLLEKRESGGVLMIAILPIVSSSVEWFRFAHYEKSE
jgi:hypothetical protein